MSPLLPRLFTRRAADPGAEHAETGEALAAAPQDEDLQLKVGGITCAGCAATIRDGLLQLPGVASAGVSPVTHRAVLRPDGSVTPEDLEMLAEAAIAGLGYRVTGRG